MCLGQGAFPIQIIAVGFREDSFVSAYALITVIFVICTIIIAAGPACLLTLNFFLPFLCRKDQNVLSPVNCWNLLLNQVKRESRDHTTLSDIYLNNIIPRFVQVSEDSGRLFKKVYGYMNLITKVLGWSSGTAS